jgi:hypothetical protein
MGELLDLWWQGYVAVAISSAARKPADRSQGHALPNLSAMAWPSIRRSSGI